MSSLVNSSIDRSKKLTALLSLDRFRPTAVVRFAPRWAMPKALLACLFGRLGGAAAPKRNYPPRFHRRRHRLQGVNSAFGIPARSRDRRPAPLAKHDMPELRSRLHRAPANRPDGVVQRLVIERIKAAEL